MFMDAISNYIIYLVCFRPEYKKAMCCTYYRANYFSTDLKVFCSVLLSISTDDFQVISNYSLTAFIIFLFGNPKYIFL